MSLLLSRLLPKGLSLQGVSFLLFFILVYPVMADRPFPVANGLSSVTDASFSAPDVLLPVSDEPLRVADKPLRRRDTVPDALFTLRKKVEKVDSTRNPLESPDTVCLADTFSRREKVQSKKDNTFTRFWQRLMKPSQDRTFVKPVDFTAAAVPNYSHEGSFGIGAMVAMSYRLDRKDSTMPPSDVTLEGSASLKAFFYAKLIGNTYFPRGRHRLLYDVRFERQDNLYWGLDYAKCQVNDAMKFTRTNLSVTINYDFQVVDNVYVGALLNFNYGQATNVSDVSYFGGQKSSYMVGGMGVSFQYDSRDFPRYPYEGFNVYFRPMVYPSKMGDYGFTMWRFTFNANYFRWLWRGAVLGVDVFSEYVTPHAPWTLRQRVGGDTRLRGYYEGRYTDNNLVSAQVELRQKLFWRLGVVIFGGCGAVYPDLDHWDWSRIVASYGIGLRLEFKKGINVRVDYALGSNAWKGDGGVFIVTMGESF